MSTGQLWATGLFHASENRSKVQSKNHYKGLGWGTQGKQCKGWQARRTHRGQATATWTLCLGRQLILRMLGKDFSKSRRPAYWAEIRWWTARGDWEILRKWTICNSGVKCRLATAFQFEGTYRLIHGQFETISSYGDETYRPNDISSLIFASEHTCPSACCHTHCHLQRCYPITVSDRPSREMSLLTASWDMGPF